MNWLLLFLIAAGAGYLLYVQVDLGLSVDDMSVSLLTFIQGDSLWNPIILLIVVVFTWLYISRIGRR